MTKYLLSLSLLLTFASSMASACDFEQEIDGKLDWQPGQLIEIQAGAGELSIRGDNESTQLKFVAKLCAPNEELGEQLEVEAGVEDGELKLVTRYPNSKINWSGSDYARIDLLVQVPQAAVLRVFDSSGAAELLNVGALSMTDSSGELDIKNVGGTLQVTDSSGELKVDAVSGDVSIVDSSGSIDVSNVTGKVVIESDSSGDIEIRQVKDLVKIEQDSSGDIEVRDVEGDVLVVHDSSGSIDVDKVGGDFSVLADSSGRIVHQNVSGKVNLPE